MNINNNVMVFEKTYLEIRSNSEKLERLLKLNEIRGIHKVNEKKKKENCMLLSC